MDFRSFVFALATWKSLTNMRSSTLNWYVRRHLLDCSQQYCPLACTLACIVSGEQRIVTFTGRAALRGTFRTDRPCLTVKAHSPSPPYRLLCLRRALVGFFIYLALTDLFFQRCSRVLCLYFPQHEPTSDAIAPVSRITNYYHFRFARQPFRKRLTSTPAIATRFCDETNRATAVFLCEPWCKHRSKEHLAPEAFATKSSSHEDFSGVLCGVLVGDRLTLPARWCRRLRRRAGMSPNCLHNIYWLLEKLHHIKCTDLFQRAVQRARSSRLCFVKQWRTRPFWMSCHRFVDLSKGFRCKS